jgi:hypothetical protein
MILYLSFHLEIIYNWVLGLKHSFGSFTGLKVEDYWLLCSAIFHCSSTSTWLPEIISKQHYLHQSLLSVRIDVSFLDHSLPEINSPVYVYVAPRYCSFRRQKNNSVDYTKQKIEMASFGKLCCSRCTQTLHKMYKKLSILIYNNIWC